MTNDVEFDAKFHYIVEEIILTIKSQEIYRMLAIYYSEYLTERKSWTRNLASKFFSLLIFNFGLIPYS